MGYSIDNEIIVRKYNDELYSLSVFKNLNHKCLNKSFEWKLWGGDFSKVIAVDTAFINGYEYYTDINGNILYDAWGQPRFTGKPPWKVCKIKYAPWKDIYKCLYLRMDQSLSRSKRRIFEISMCNDFDWFVTLTIDEKKFPRDDVQLFKKELGSFIHRLNMTAKHKINKIKYILIPEYHKDGKSIHMHGLIMGLDDDELYINKYGYYGWKPYEDKFGFISMDRIKFKNRCASYITKYITKETAQAVASGKQAYICSKGLKRPEILIDTHSGLLGEVDWDFQNEYMKKKTFHDDAFLSVIKGI